MKEINKERVDVNAKDDYLAILGISIFITSLLFAVFYVVVSTGLKN